MFRRLSVFATVMVYTFSFLLFLVGFANVLMYALVSMQYQSFFIPQVAPATYWFSLPLFVASFVLFEVGLKYGAKTE